VRLQRLIEDLLHYQRAVAGVEHLKLVKVDLAEVVQAAIDEQRLNADGRSIEFALEATPAPLLGDGEMLRVVVDNLLSNAVMYSPVGGAVAVAVAPRARDVALGSRMRLACRDRACQRSDCFQASWPTGAR
jgi:signal transduction histidine kinase